MACTTATCTIPIRLPDDSGIGNTTVSAARVALGRNGNRIGRRLGRVSAGPRSIATPEGHDCGCGPSCGCDPCQAAHHGDGTDDGAPAFEGTLSANKITAQMMGSPQGLAALGEGRKRASELADEGVATAFGGDKPEEATSPSGAVATRASFATPRGAVSLLGVRKALRRGTAKAEEMVAVAEGRYDVERDLTDADIHVVQMTLRDGGFSGNCGFVGLPLAVDGYLGPSTRMAIRQFQQRQGLAVDGVLWPQTRNALRDFANRQAAPRLSRDEREAEEATRIARNAAMAPAYDPQATKPSGMIVSERPMWAMGYTDAQWAAMNPQTRDAARAMHAAGGHRPAGAVNAPRMIPTRPWNELSPEDRASLVAGAARFLPVGTPMLGPAGVVLPPWAASTYSQAQWDEMSAERRASLQAAEDERVRAGRPDQGWAFGGAILQAGSQIAAAFINGETQREVARLQQAIASGQQNAQVEIAAFTARTNQEIARLQAETARDPNVAAANAQMVAALQAAQAAASGNQAAQMQFQQQMMAMQQQAQAAQAQSSRNMMIGVGAVGLLGFGAYILTQKKR